jgi:hypothetical protein
MARNRHPDEAELRHAIGRRAWAEAEQKAKFHYDFRKAELLAEAGLKPGKPSPPHDRHRKERTERFRKWVLDLLADDDVIGLPGARNNALIAAIDIFLKQSTMTQRNALIAKLKNNPHWLGDRLAEFWRFT